MIKNKKASNKLNSKSTTKNISKKIPNGRTLKTSDKHLPGKNGGKMKNKRRVVVVDSNKNDELAVVRITTQEQQILPLYQAIIKTHILNIL